MSCTQLGYIELNGIAFFESKKKEKNNKIETRAVSCALMTLFRSATALHDGHIQFVVVSLLLFYVWNLYYLNVNNLHAYELVSVCVSMWNDWPSSISNKQLNALSSQ